MNHKGFTLVELIVIMTIFAIMASVALFNFQGFKSDVAVNNMAHDIALLLREAQTFGWATQSGQNGQVISIDAFGNPIRLADGAFFKYNSTTENFADDIILYKKQNPTEGNYFFDDTVDATIDHVSVQGHYGVVAILGADEQQRLALTSDEKIPTANTIVEDVSVGFSRPKPEAFIFNGISRYPYHYIGIYIGERGQSLTAQKVIIVAQSGEIWVQ